MQNFCITSHSVSLGTIALANHLHPPTQTLKNLTSPPRQTKSPDNSNILHMFNINTYTDSRTVYKQVLIPSYVIQVI